MGMIANYFFYTKCDQKGCRCVANKTFLDVAGMVQHLKECGWSVDAVAGKYFCPEHKKKEDLKMENEEKKVDVNCDGYAVDSLKGSKKQLLLFIDDLEKVIKSDEGHIEEARSRIEKYKKEIENVDAALDRLAQ